MTAVEIKKDIHSIIEGIQNVSILEELRWVLKDVQKADSQGDFWDELSEERQKNIDQALKEVEEGKTIPHAEVQKRIRESIRQVEKDIEDGKVYTVEEAREMMQKKRKNKSI